MMPDISGFDTAVVLKKDEETKDIPIIFLTALNTPQDLVHGFQVGASDFLTKPFNKEELVMRVMQQISLVAAKRIIEKQNAELRATLSNRDKMYSVIAHDLVRQWQVFAWFLILLLPLLLLKLLAQNSMSCLIRLIANQRKFTICLTICSSGLRARQVVSQL
jgi:DNA-binding response OmpR family regulator